MSSQYALRLRSDFIAGGKAQQAAGPVFLINIVCPGVRR